MNTETQELTVIQELTAKLQEEGITQEIIKKSAEFKELTIAGQDDKEGYKKVKESRIQLKNTRVPIERICKQARDIHTAINRQISTQEAEWVSPIAEAEKYLQQQQDAYEAEQERIRKESAEKERIRLQGRVDQLQALGAKVDFQQVALMNDADFAAQLNDTQIAWQQEQDRKALEAEQAKLKITRNAELLKLQFQYLGDDLGQITSEAYQALKDEKQADFDAAKAEKERVAKEAADNKAEAERLAKIAADQLAEEAKLLLAKKEHEQREAALQQKEAELSKPIETPQSTPAPAFQASGQPIRTMSPTPSLAFHQKQTDIQKLQIFADNLTSLPFPEIKDIHVFKIMNDAKSTLSVLRETISQQLKSL